MNRQEKRNDSVLKKGFARLLSSKDRSAEEGLKDLLENAMLYALGEHDLHHWFHKSTENSYGWCLLHDGHSVASKVNEGRHGGGNAYEQLMAASREVPQTGWVGILLASFRAGDDRPNPRMFYFSVDYEMEILNRTTGHIEADFNRFFKPLATK